MANIERTGWRDAEISARHRKWGVLCHGCDLDFVLIEHCYGFPVALVEYKHLGVDEAGFTGANFQAMRSLADASQIPFVICVYDPETWGVRVFPMNVLARSDFNWGVELTERQWVEWLHRARSRLLDERTRDGLNDDLPGPPLARAS